MKKITIILLVLISTSLSAFWHSFFPQQMIVQPQKPSRKGTIMLAPFGDSTTQGRSLNSNFEFTIAHNFVNALKKEIEEQFTEIRVVISHNKMNALSPMQIANAANCLSADILLNFQFYLEKDSMPHLYLYQCSYRNDFLSKRWDLSWCHVDEAYLINKKPTTSWAKIIADKLADPDYAKLFTINGPYTIPLKPLAGIIAPALLVEIGLKEDDVWKQLITPIVDSLKPIILEICNNVKRETE